MKRITLLLAAVCAAFSSVKAQTVIETVGNEDLSSGFWGAQSTAYTISKGQTLTWVFKNTSVGTAFYNNYIVVLANSASGSTGYAEYLVLRADNWAWGNSNTDYSLIAQHLVDATTYDYTTSYYNEDDRDVYLTSNFNWDYFIADLNGATVTTTVSLSNDGFITVNNTYTGVSTSTAYTYIMTHKNAISEDNITAFLTIDAGAYLEIYSAEITTEAVGTAVSSIEEDAEVVSVEYYNLAGKKVAADEKGIVIVKSLLSNGEVEVSKTINR